ncbi:MAG: DUF6340 family protein [Myxococcota bacterium]|nr:DUF6340 family protein [Myxococcota bacterium]
MISLLFAMACSPSITFQITNPAEVKIKQQIQKIAPIDREESRASRKVIDSFMNGLEDVRNPRFAMISRATSQKAFADKSSTVGQPLTREQAQTICKSTEASGIVSLERLRVQKDWEMSDYQTTKREEERQTIVKDGEETEQTVYKDKVVTMHRAVFTVGIDVDWKLYNCSAGVEDSHTAEMSNTWRGEGESVADAKAQVGETRDLIAEMAAQHGVSYMRRISPYEISVTRKYYRCGHKKMKEANKLMVDGKIMRAEKRYLLAIEDSVQKEKGKSHFNYAVLLERMGKTKQALEQAKKGHEIMQSGMSQTYVDQLRNRVKKEKRIKRQLGQ